MIIAIFLLTFVVVLSVIYLSIIWDNDYWEKRGIPYEKPSFFFGNIKEALQGNKHLGILHTELYTKFKQFPYMGYFKLKSPILLINDVEFIKDILVKNFNDFSYVDFTVDEKIDPIWTTNPFSKRDEDWKTARAQWSSSITQSKVKGMYPVIYKKGENMVDFIKDHIKQNPEVPLEAREIASNYLTDVIVSAVFGLEINSFRVNDNVFRKISRSVFTATFWDSITNMIFVVAPWLGKIFQLKFVSNENKHELLKIARDIMACRSETGVLKNAVYESMNKHNLLDSGKETSVIELAGRVFGFLLDGTETSSGSLGFMFYELAANPNIQAKLRAELDNAASSDGTISHDDLLHLPYLDMIVSETLRMYPPGLSINRICSRSCELPPAVPGGQPLKVPAGMSVTIPVYAVHMDPGHFPSPEIFDPDRFSEENRANIKKFSYLPFGEGPRICIGRKLAQVQAKVAAASIIKNFEIRLNPATQMKRPYQPDPNVLAYRSIQDLLINFYERK